MQINYIEKDGKKLFSFYRHDYQRFDSGEFIDGGFDYTRSSGDLKSDTIWNLIADIRQQFRWGQNYDKNDKLLPETKYSLLKDLDFYHIIGILRYFTEKLSPPQSINAEWKAFHLIFLYELQYRIINQIEETKII
jgi:hypothetical protein